MLRASVSPIYVYALTSSFRSHAMSRNVTTRVRALRSLLGLSHPTNRTTHTWSLCRLSYPERIAQQRTAPGRYRLRNGAGAVLPVTAISGDVSFLLSQISTEAS